MTKPSSAGCLRRRPGLDGQQLSAAPERRIRLQLCIFKRKPSSKESSAGERSAPASMSTTWSSEMALPAPCVRAEPPRTRGAIARRVSNGPTLSCDMARGENPRHKKISMPWPWRLRARRGCSGASGAARTSSAHPPVTRRCSTSGRARRACRSAARDCIVPWPGRSSDYELSISVTGIGPTAQFSSC